MTDTREPVLIIDLDPAHLSAREKALRAIYGNPGLVSAEMVIAVDEPPRPTDLAVQPKRTVKQKFDRPVKRPRRVIKEKSASLKRLLAK
jgi:hypothetical protein